MFYPSVTTTQTIRNDWFIFKICLHTTQNLKKASGGTESLTTSFPSMAETSRSIGGLSVGVQSCNFPLMLKACKQLVVVSLCLTRKVRALIVRLNLSAKPHSANMHMAELKQGPNRKKYQMAENLTGQIFQRQVCFPLK